MLLVPFNLNEYQKSQFREYYKILSEENQKYNITAITEETDVYIKHFYDSLAGSFAMDFSGVKTYCDIGSGGGFPAIPLKIMFPHLRLTLIEPNGKKVNFLKMLLNRLALPDVEIISERAESFVEVRREHYDVVSARAVAILPMLLELSIPFLRIEGFFLAYKGSNYKKELSISGGALQTLYAAICDVYEYILPQEMGRHVIIKIQKLKATKGIYPRIYGQIKKRHL